VLKVAADTTAACVHVFDLTEIHWWIFDYFVFINRLWSVFIYRYVIIHLAHHPERSVYSVKLLAKLHPKLFQILDSIM
jgi:ribosomal silencing factor RsfS